MTADLKGVSCLVLGGGGFIGRALIDSLRRKGARVQGFGRVGLFGKPVIDLPWIEGDFRDTVSLARAVEGNEVVFHLLGGSTPESSNVAPLSDLNASVSGTAELLEICRVEGVRKILFASSGGTVYGIPNALPIQETAPTNPISAYGVNKLAAEKYLYLYDYLYKIDHVVLRISNPFGPFQSPWRRQGLVAATILKLLSGVPIEIWGDGSVTRDYIFIDDVIDAFVKATLYKGECKVFNIGSGVGLTVNEVIDDISSVLDIKNPQKTFKTSRLVDVPANILDIGLATRELHWSPSNTWFDAIKTTASWMHNNAAVRDFIEKGKL